MDIIPKTWVLDLAGDVPCWSPFDEEAGEIIGIHLYAADPPKGSTVFGLAHPNGDEGIERWIAAHPGVIERFGFVAAEEE
jgi:hypothetical protein